jgi:hypothetical protein
MHRPGATRHASSVGLIDQHVIHLYREKHVQGRMPRFFA